MTIPAVSSDSSSSSTANSTSVTNNANDPSNLASEDTFLKLFVAQLQNQDPLNPNEQDPTQMVSELAQFSELEQMVNIGSDVQSIDQAITGTSSAANTTSQPSSSDSTNNQSTSSSQAA